MSRAALTLVLLCLVLIQVGAQEWLVEVASVKRHPPGDNTQWMISPQPGGRLRLRMTPERLIAVAYRLQMDQVINAPGWAKSDTYDILLKVAAGANISIDTIAPIAREVLVDRFTPMTHTDTRELPVYRLVRSRPDGGPSPRLAPAHMDCTLRGGPPPPRQAGDAVQAAASRCGLTQRGGTIAMGGFPLDAFTRVLSTLVGRVVVNQTGLSGNWDLDLEYTPEAPPGSGPVNISSDAPSLFTALSEQLGLKLEAGGAPVDVIVVDALSRPTED